MVFRKLRWGTFAQLKFCDGKSGKGGHNASRISCPSVGHEGIRGPVGVERSASLSCRVTPGKMTSLPIVYMGLDRS
jgi:hypothetical protein